MTGGFTRPPRAAADAEENRRLRASAPLTVSCTDELASVKDKALEAAAPPRRA